MRIDVVSIFPQMFDAVRGSGMTRIALERKKLQLELWDPRNFCEDRYRRVGEGAYGGGAGEDTTGLQSHLNIVCRLLL